MAVPRSEQVDLDATQYYHCITRCVRKAFLCGEDNDRGKNYSHRKQWLVNKFKTLTKIFAINICAYAVMSNYYHLVLFVDICLAKSWSNEEVKDRWSMLFPKNAGELDKMHPEMVAQKIKEWRERLTNISWFMRCLNENIALRANAEDQCKGRFWEGRFKSQALLDEGALLTAMAYVDLNPIRAKLANTPEESEFTSINERIQFAAKQSSFEESLPKESLINNLEQPKNLMPFSNNSIKDKDIAQIDFNFSDYLELVDHTGRIIREDKRGFIPENLASIIDRLNLTIDGWIMMTKSLEDKFFYAVGNEDNLKEFGQSFRYKKFPKGPTAALQCYLGMVA